MITVTQTAEATITGKLTATDMRGFLNEIPGDAELTITEILGNGMKPAEARLKATWTKAQAERPNLVRPPAMRGATVAPGLTHESDTK